MSRPTPNPASGAGLRCVVCDAQRWSEHRPNRAYSRCGGCRSLRLTADPDDTVDLYGPEYFTAGANAGYVDYGGDETLHRANAEDRLDDIEAAGADRRGCLVDVGCAYGYTLDAARDRGWSTVGVDISAHARMVASSRGHQVAATLDDAAKPATVVSFYQVLEHMPDPARALASAARLLEPGGHLAIETWNADSMIARAMGPLWHQLSPPSVVHIWTADSLRQLVTSAGFTSVEITRATKAVSFAAAFGLLAGKYEGVVGRGFRRLAEMPVASRPLRYGLGDLIKLTATRA